MIENFQIGRSLRASESTDLAIFRLLAAGHQGPQLVWLQEAEHGKYSRHDRPSFELVHLIPA